MPERMEGMDMAGAASTGSQSVVLTLAVSIVGVMVGYLLCAFVVFALSFIFGGRVT